MRKTHIVVSRHPGAIRWIADRLAESMAKPGESPVVVDSVTLTEITLLVGYTHPTTGFVTMAQDGTEQPVFEHVRVVSGNATPDDVRDREVWGNVPYHLGAAAKCVHAIEFDGEPPRGSEYTQADMIRAGAHVSIYIVRRPYDWDWTHVVGLRRVDPTTELEVLGWVGWEGLCIPDRSQAQNYPQQHAEEVAREWSAMGWLTTVHLVERTSASSERAAS